MIDVLLIGTGVGVGKTRLAILYASRALAKGRTPGYLKAVQTGSTDDARAVAAGAPGTVCATAYRFVAPLAPAVAARLQHAGPPDVQHLIDATEELRAATDGIVIEAGSLLEPLGDGTTYADLAHAVGLPIVIVTRPDTTSLGVVALTVEVARTRGLAVAGIAVTGCAHRPDLAERTTRAELAALAIVVESVAGEAVTVV